MCDVGLLLWVTPGCLPLYPLRAVVTFLAVVLQYHTLPEAIHPAAWAVPLDTPTSSYPLRTRLLNFLLPTSGGLREGVTGVGVALVDRCSALTAGNIKLENRCVCVCMFVHVCVCMHVSVCAYITSSSHPDPLYPSSPTSWWHSPRGRAVQQNCLSWRRSTTHNRKLTPSHFDWSTFWYLYVCLFVCLFVLCFVFMRRKCPILAFT